MNQEVAVVTRSEFLDTSGEYLDFIREYRKIQSLPLGGTRSVSHKYHDLTSRTVLSVGIVDDRGQLPFRVSASNFKLSYPITSYGCIVRSPITSTGDVSATGYKYLLIQRTDTIEYLECISGQYQESQLFYLLRSLTLEERQRLIKYKDDFDTLWLDNRGLLIDNEIYRWSKDMFSRIGPNLDKILDLVESSDPHGKNKWLFPKGRLEYRSSGLSTPVPESPWEAAEREFKEESNGLSLDNAKFVFSNPVQEIFFGSNSKNYATHYFVLEIPQANEPTQFPHKQTSIRSVSSGEAEQIMWVSSEDLDLYLTPDRLRLIREIESKSPEPDCVLNSQWLNPVDSTLVSADL